MTDSRTFSRTLAPGGAGTAAASAIELSPLQTSSQQTPPSTSLIRPVQAT